MPVAAAIALALSGWFFASPASADGPPTPSPTAPPSPISPSPSSTPQGSSSPAPSGTAAPSAGATSSASPATSPTASARASVSPNPGASPSPAPSPTPSPSPAGSTTPSVSPSPTPSATPSAPTAETIAKDAALLASARSLAQLIAAQAVAARDDTTKRAAEVAVLEQLANEAAAAQTSLAQLIAAALPQAQGSPASTWQLPARGPVSLAFGPTAFALEPSLVYQGTLYPHFHAAIDIAAPFGTPVAAGADGIVTYVGHLPDGAEIVLIAHAGGYVSEYAHLDDTFVAPPVKPSQTANAGQGVAFAGLTGITTGPHLHFAILRNGIPVDPLLLISRS